LVRSLAGFLLKPEGGPGAREQLIEAWFAPGEKVAVHFRPAGETTYARADLEVPPLPKDAPPGQFRRRYSISLDAHGVLRLHAGEVPYWTTDDPSEMAAQPGRVLVRLLSPAPLSPDAQHDPFSGVH